MQGYENGMYMQQYDGDGWYNYAEGQAWYDPQAYDCSSWCGTGGYEQQGQQGMSAASGGASSMSGGWGDAQSQSAGGPNKGAELLTELRLAELKRLIDRDAQALRLNAKCEGLEDDSCDTAECSTRAGGESTEDSPIKEDMQSQHSARRHAGKVQNPGGQGLEACPSVSSSGRSSAQSAQPPPPPAPCAGPAAPGLDAPVEQRYVVYKSYSPESRTHGEMPVSAGDEIFATDETGEDWLFGIKRSRDGSRIDEGWLPVEALMPDDAAPEKEKGASQGSKSSRQGKTKEKHSQQSRASAGPSGKSGKKATADQPKQKKGAASAQGHKAAYAEPQPKSKAKSSVSDDAWHEHGNWWSRQRHLTAPSKGHDDHRPKERPVRERQSLQSMLDRLNRPLVPPKPKDED